jgi:hypothetical protein
VRMMVQSSYWLLVHDGWLLGNGVADLKQANVVFPRAAKR